jgi:hypothetical protein
MRGKFILVFATAGMSLAAAPACAQTPVAVVEEVKGKPAGVEFMDYVAAGKVIRLGPQDSIVLGYIKSCWRETITGGTVTVGADQSEVRLGKVERTKVACDAGRMQLTEQQASQSAGMVFRGLPSQSGQEAAMPKPQFTLSSVSPIVELKGGGTLLIERLDQPGEHYAVIIGSRQLLRGSFYDFARADRKLAVGGIYRASVGAQERIFKVDPHAKAGPAPILGRLLRFQPAS